MRFTLICFLLIFSGTTIFSANFFIDTAKVSKQKKEIIKVENANHYLILTGEIKQLRQHQKSQELPLDSAIVMLLDSSGNLVSENLSTIKRPVVLKLKLETSYTIRIKKAGYVTKYFEVNTVIPKEKLRPYNFRFDLYLYEKIEGVDYSLLNNAVAIIEYIPKREKFDYDFEYTRQVNETLKRQYKNLYYTKKD